MKISISLLMVALLFIACGKDSDPGSTSDLELVSVTITGVTVNSYPATKSNGTSWDILGDLPDVYLQLQEGVNLVAFSSIKENMTNNTAHTFTLPYTITDLDVTHTLLLGDSDLLDDDDLIAAISLEPRDIADGLVGGKYNILGTTTNVDIIAVAEYK